MLNNIYFLENVNRDFNDMYLCYCGLEKCSSLYSFGPAIRPNYLLHYVLDGRGYYYVNDTKYTVKKNQGFLITPNVVTFYQADKDEPWTYLWIGIDGTKVDFYLKLVGLDENNLIFNSKNNNELRDYVMNMMKNHKSSIDDYFKIEGLLYLFFSKLAEDNKPLIFNNEETCANRYISKTIEFIQNNYHSPIQVNDIANYVGLNRSYLTSLFDKHLKMSPRKFLIEFRITKSAELLYNTDLSISNIAYSCGYSDPLAFSKAFKKIKGVSPTEYRANKEFLNEQFSFKE